jgi:hypothetical protein
MRPLLRRCITCGLYLHRYAFVGMEPAVKPAAENTTSGVVGVLATPATFQGALYASVVERFAHGVTVLTGYLSGVGAANRTGQLDTPTTRAILERLCSRCWRVKSIPLYWAARIIPLLFP